MQKQEKLCPYFVIRGIFQEVTIFNNIFIN